MPYKTETYTVYNPVFDQSKYRNSADAARHGALTFRNETKTRQVWYDAPAVTAPSTGSTGSTSKGSTGSTSTGSTKTTTNPFVTPTKYNSLEALTYKMNPALAEKMYQDRIAKEATAAKSSSGSTTTPAFVGPPAPEKKEVPALNPFESALIKTKSPLAEILYEKRTGEQLPAYLDLTPDKKTEPTVQGFPLSFVQQNLPGDTKIETSPFLSKYGFKPTDYDYPTIESQISSNISTTKQNIFDIESAVSKSKTVIPEIRLNISTVKSAPEGTLWYDPRDTEGKKTIGKSELLPLLQENLTQWETAASYESKLSGYRNELSELEKTQRTVKKYEEEGYNVDITDQGYQFSLPSAYEAHVGLYGEEKTNAMLGAASFMESPLGLKMLAQYGATALTGDKKWAEAERESLAGFSLGLSNALKNEGLLGYAREVSLSPAIIEGVYIPALTLGAGYALTGLSAGASGAVTTGSQLAKIGATTGGKIALTAGQTGMIAIGGIGVVSTGITLGTGAAQRPEELPGLLAETGFTFGLGYAGYKAGSTAYTQKYTGSWKYNWKTGRSEWTEYEVPKAEVSIGKSDILEFKYPEKNVFYSAGQEVTSGGKKGVVYDFEAYGGEEFPGGRPPGQDVSKVTGVGKVSWTEKAPGIRGHLGATESHTRFFDLASVSEPVNPPAGYKGDLKFSVVDSLSSFRGQPRGATASKGITASLDMGTLEPGPYQMIRSPMQFEGVGGSKITVGLPEKNIFTYLGKYSGENVRGYQMDVGKVYSWEFGAPKQPTTTVSGQGGVTQFGSKVSQMLAGVKGETKTVTTPKEISVPSASGGVSLISTNVEAQTEKQEPLGVAPGHIVDLGVTQYDIHGLYGEGQKQTGGGWATLTPITVAPIEVTGQGSGSRSGRRRGRGRGSALGQGPSTETDLAQDSQGIGELGGTDVFVSLVVQPGVREDTRLDLGLGLGTDLGMGLDLGLGQRSNIRQGSRQQQDQLTDLVSLTDLETVTVVTPVVHQPNIPHTTRPKIPRVPPEEEELGRKHKHRKKSGRRQTTKTGESDVGIYSDILSVTHSQAKYGKATHPRISRRLWKIGEKTSFLRVPTMEMIREKSKSKARRRKRKRHVFY